MSTGSSCSRRSASTASKAISTCATDRSSPSRWGRAPPKDGRRKRDSEMTDDRAFTGKMDFRFSAENATTQEARARHTSHAQVNVSRERSSVDEACARLREVLNETRQLPRREFLRALAKAAAGSALLAPIAAIATRAAQAAEPPITYFTYGGASKQAISSALFDPFTKKTGIPVQYQEPYTFAKLRAMHEAKAQQIDIAGLSGMDVYIAARIKMISPIDWTLVDKSALDPQQVHHENVIS